MGVSSVWFALGTMLVNDYESLLQRGLFHGYSPMIWTVIANQAFGGLIVAMVVRDADSILKGFATSASIILSGAISVVLLDFQPSSLFLGGSLVVIASVYLYSLPDNGHSKAKR